MRRKDKHTINMRTTNVLKTLMKNPGGYLHLSNYHCTNGSRRELYERVTHTLQLMGIKYQVQKGTFKIRILTDEQIKTFEALKSGTFSQRYGYGPSTGRAHRITVDEVFG